MMKAERNLGFLVVSLIFFLILTLGCTAPSEQKITGATTVFTTTLIPAVSELNSSHQTQRVVMTPYLTDATGEKVIGGFEWPNDHYNITFDYEIWSLNCLICEKGKYDEKKGMLVYRGTAFLNKSNPSIRLNMPDLLPPGANVVSVIQTGNKMYAVTDDQEPYQIVDLGQNFGVFGTIKLPDGKILPVADEGDGFFPPIEKFILSPHDN